MYNNTREILTGIKNFRESSDRVGRSDRHRFVKNLLVSLWKSRKLFVLPHHKHIFVVSYITF